MRVPQSRCVYELGLAVLRLGMKTIRDTAADWGRHDVGKSVFDIVHFYSAVVQHTALPFMARRRHGFESRWEYTFFFYIRLLNFLSSCCQCHLDEQRSMKNWFVINASWFIFDSQSRTVLRPVNVSVFFGWVLQSLLSEVVPPYAGKDKYAVWRLEPDLRVRA
jgi:hypothetical protein